MKIMILGTMALLVVGCGSMQVRRVPVEATVNGVRVQVAEPHVVVAVVRGAGGVPVVQTAELTLPSPDEHYDLDFKGALFTTREIAIELNGAGTLKKYSFTTDSNLDEALQSAASAAQSAAGIRAEVKAADAAKEDAPAADPIEVENAALRIQIVNDMLRANQAAAAAGAPLPYPFLFE